MNHPGFQHPGLHFDIEGAMFWYGRPLEPSAMRAVLEAFPDLVAVHLMGWWEKFQLHQSRGKLPQSGILAEMASLEPLRDLLNFFRAHLEPEEHFADRLDTKPEAPKLLSEPKTRFRFPASTLAGELERRNASRRDAQAWEAFENRQREIAAFQNEARTFPERLAKGCRYPAWKQEMKKLERAYSLLAAWEAKLEEAKRLPGWDFLPPGPGLSYSPQWLKSFLGLSNPDATYDFDRIREIQSLDPVAIRRGSVGSVSGYLAFVFSGDRVALESALVGNALYFFRRDWQDLSRRPKGELRRMMAHGDQRIDRFEHKPGHSLRDCLRGHLIHE